MPYKIAIASGKGGTGKTTVAVNLFMQLIKNSKGKIALIDCDVEEPNDTIFFRDSKKKADAEITQSIPSVDNNKCTFCRKCAEYCEYNAIVVIPPVKFAEVNASLCHSCGACMVACEYDAITEHDETIGTLSSYIVNHKYGIAEGRLKVGSVMQTMLIKELKKRISNDHEILIYDAPPGTTCQVVATISDVNYVILVAEPTPFGLHDMKLMVVLLRELDLSFGIIINKAGLGNNKIYEFIEQEGLDLLGEIPFNKNYAAQYAEGKLIENIPKEIKECYEVINDNLFQKIMQYEGNNSIER